jgi:hypothetical protein
LSLLPSTSFSFSHAVSRAFASFDSPSIACAFNLCARQPLRIFHFYHHRHYCYGLPGSTASSSAPFSPVNFVTATARHSFTPTNFFSFAMADYSSLKVPELKKLLAEKKLSQTGNKADLIARLQEDDKKNATASATDDSKPGM